ncbi:MAG: extracellular solute-binding protein [Oscillospiraceae bacterium]|nr:extracellular solute-binding protein [Oscillospiraceae bacterium]
MKNAMKKYLALALALLMVLSLVACGGETAPATEAPAADPAPAPEADPAPAPEADPAPAEGVTIKFQQWWGVELPEGYLQGIADDFEAETGIKVELISAPWSDTKTAITAGAANGTIADVISVDGAWLAEFSEMGLLADLEAAGLNTELAGDVWSVNGVKHVVPVNNFTYPMYVNMDILNASGVEAIPTTWTELVDACKKIADAGYSAFALNLGVTNANGIQNVFMHTGWASGIGLKNEAGEYDVAGNEDIKALAELYKTLYDNGCLYAGMSTLEEAEMTSNFAAGNCAFTVASAATMGEFSNLDFEAALIPVKDGYEGQSGICYASWAAGISEASEHKAEAAQWLNYLLGGIDGTDGSVSAGLASTQTAFPNSKIANPDYSATPAQFQSFYELYKENYVINEFIGLPNASSVMTDMTNDLVLYLEGDLDVDTLLNNWQGYLDNAGA